ncbi:MAG: hypothetical protein KBF73_01055 [Flavobacteriales bacterium]|nr:hypothetical protein [Flavobacteriales bacterium]
MGIFKSRRHLHHSLALVALVVSFQYCSSPVLTQNIGANGDFRILQEDNLKISRVIAFGNARTACEDDELYQLLAELKCKRTESDSSWQFCVYHGIDASNSDLNQKPRDSSLVPLNPKNGDLSFINVNNWKTLSEWDVFYGTNKNQYEHLNEADTELGFTENLGKKDSVIYSNSEWVSIRTRMARSLANYNKLGIEDSQVRFACPTCRQPNTPVVYRGAGKFRVWFQDQFLAFTDGKGQHLLRSVDVIAGDVVLQNLTSCAGVNVSSGTLAVQGGNLLASKDFAIVGMDDLIKLAAIDSVGRNGFPSGKVRQKITRMVQKELFGNDSLAKIIWAGNLRKVGTFLGSKDTSGYQPIYHLDVGLTLIGKLKQQKGRWKGKTPYFLLVGMPDHRWQNYDEASDSSYVKEAKALVDSLACSIRLMKDSLVSNLSAHFKSIGEVNTIVVAIDIPLPLHIKIPTTEFQPYLRGYYSYCNGLVSGDSNGKNFYIPKRINPLHDSTDTANLDAAEKQLESVLRQIDHLNPLYVQNSYWDEAALRCYLKVNARE